MSRLSPRRVRQLADFLAANLCIVSVLALSFVGMLLLSSFTRDPIALSTIPLLGASVAVTLAAVALSPEATWSRIGLGRRSAPGLLWGTVLGGAAVGGLVLAAVALEWAAWTPPNPSAIRFDWRETRLMGLALLAVGAAGEELAFRGLALQFLARAAGPSAAVAVTSAGFAWLHGQNPGLTDLAQVNTALFGAAFGIAALRRRSLWPVIGLHFGWNAAQVGLGVNTSGITIRLTELNLELGGARWLTGGDYGLEGGVLATGMAVALGAGFALLPRRKGGRQLLWQADRAGAGPAALAGAGARGVGPRLAGRKDNEADGDPAG